MRAQRRIASGIALVALVSALVAVVPARAAPGHALGPWSGAATSGSPATGGYPSEITKQTLADTSIGAPALWTTATGTVRSVLAWTGTDAAHHLNVMTSGIGSGSANSDEVAYSNKKTLPDTSFVSLAVARSSDGKVVVAWVGNDARHSLNVVYDVYGSYTKRTLVDTSFTTPALAMLGNQVVLAWAGTDANHSLNTFTLTTPGLGSGTKTTMRAFTSDAPPSLTFDSLGSALGRNNLILSWSARSPSNALRYATSTDASTWSTPVALPESSGSGASLIGIPQANNAYMPGHYLAWTGTNAARSVNFQFSDTFYTATPWPNPAATKLTMAEQAFGAVQVGFAGGPKQLVVAWTGTDAAHHLNTALAAPSSPCVGVPGFTSLSGDVSVISHGNTTRRQVALTFDAAGDVNAQTTKILDILEQTHTPAEWNIEGRFAQTHPEIVRRVASDGFELGNHSVDHPHFPANPAVSNDYICAELTFADQIVGDVTGGHSTRPYFRPPFGELGPVFTFNPVTSQVSNVAAQVGYRTVTWSVDPRDWETTITTQQILDRVFTSPNLGNGAIILLHAGGLHTGDALSPLIAGLQARGFTIVSLSQLLQS